VGGLERRLTSCSSFHSLLFPPVSPPFSLEAAAASFLANGLVVADRAGLLSRAGRDPSTAAERVGLGYRDDLTDCTGLADVRAGKGRGARRVVKLVLDRGFLASDVGGRRRAARLDSALVLFLSSSSSSSSSSSLIEMVRRGKADRAVLSGVGGRAVMAGLVVCLGVAVGRRRYLARLQSVLSVRPLWI
jgi:hypothetical protein